MSKKQFPSKYEIKQAIFNFENSAFNEIFVPQKRVEKSDKRVPFVYPKDQISGSEKIIYNLPLVDLDKEEKESEFIKKLKEKLNQAVNEFIEENGNLIK